MPVIVSVGLSISLLISLNTFVKPTEIFSYFSAALMTATRWRSKYNFGQLCQKLIGTAPSLLTFAFPANKAKENNTYDDCLVNLAPSIDSLTGILPDS